MAYGVSCRSFLRFIMRIPVAVCSAIVHVAELPLTIVSGISHLRMKNVDIKLLWLLLVPGMLGAVLGSYLVSYSNDTIELIVDAYLVLMGVKILMQAFGYKLFANAKLPSWAKGVIALTGGFFDAFGGGGWGPIVTSSLIGNDGKPHLIVGTVNLAEFYITAVQVLFFGLVLTSLSDYWMHIVAIIIGGIVAAPIAAKLCSRLSQKNLLLFVGIVIILVNVYGLINLLR